MTYPVTVLPIDEANQTLLSYVHPPDWVNPTPADPYDLVVIGGGTAGLVTAAGAAGLGLGLRVALVERFLMGGDCLNVGCVPSKCMIRSSRVVAEMQRAGDYGIEPPQNIQVDFAAVMARMRQVRAAISPNDSVQRFQGLGIDVFLGEAKFLDPRRLTVEGQTLRFKRAVIATGARAAKPQISGLAEVGYLTNETVFSLTERPQRLGVIGGGPIGCELAQAFHRLGSTVTIFHRSGQILQKEDPDAADLVQQVFRQEGIQLKLNCQIQQVTRTPQGIRVQYLSDDQPGEVMVDQLLVGTGRAPNVEGLNLEAAGVAYGPHGVEINDYLQTTNPKVFAAGDICMDWKFTHAADAAARLVIKNALFAPFGLGRSRLSHLIMPWATYTEPEIAHVGLYEAEAQAQGMEVDTIKIPFSSVDRAIADGEENGFVKILHPKGSDKILGATVVARHAGDLISEITTAMVGGLGLNSLANTIHPYPTQAEAIKKAADAYRRTLLTPRTQALLRILTKLP